MAEVVKKSSEVTYVLTLTEAEASVVREMTGCIAGNWDNSFRAAGARVWQALYVADVPRPKFNGADHPYYYAPSEVEV